MVETDKDGGKSCFQEKVESAALEWLMIRVESPQIDMDIPRFSWEERRHENTFATDDLRGSREA